MPNQGLWSAGLEGTADRLNAGLLQYDVFANRPAAGQTGRLFYATDTQLLYRDNGASWDTVSVPPIVVKTADETVTSSTVLQNDDELFLPVEANQRYAVLVFLRLNGVEAADIKFAFSLPAGASGGWAQWNSNNNDPLAELDITAAASFATTDVFNQITAMRGYILVGATAGNAQLQWAQLVSNVGATKVLAGSWLKLERQ